MTPIEDALNRAAPEPSEAGGGYPVGYGKPPAEHRFKKGKSPNPGGKRKVKPCRETVPRLPTGSLYEMVMLETDRMVRVKAGGRMVEIPAIQASIRALAMRAAKGDRLATVTLAQLRMRSDAEAPAAGTHAEEMQTIAEILEAAHERACRTPEEAAIAAAEEYKAVWTKVLSSLSKVEAEVLEPTPHPDDVTIGRVRGTVTWPGARAGETLSLDGLAKIHADLQASLPKRRAAVEAMEEGHAKAIQWLHWFAMSDVRARIAVHLPERYAAQIAPDTRSGAEHMRDRTLRVMAADERRRWETASPPQQAE